jgi:CelD/BcsL family acetyltransferase involved in cellulose biosynthesis
VSVKWLHEAGGELLAEWQSVLRRSDACSPFISPAFLIPWQRAFAQSRPVRVGRWELGGEASGFLFLCGRGDGLPGWEFMGGTDVSDILDAPVVRGMAPAFWDEMLPAMDELLREGPVQLQSLPADSQTPGILAQRCPDFGYSLRIDETDISPWLPLPAAFDDYVDGLEKKARHELRRKMRRASEALPGMAFRICREPADVAAAIPAFLELHRRSHPDKADFMTEGMAGFFGEIALRLSGDGAIRLALLSDAGGDVAAAFQLVSGDRLLLYNSGFDPARRDANPGLVLIARCIEAAISEGFREYDFLRGTERYKYDLGGRDRAVRRATIASTAT